MPRLMFLVVVDFGIVLVAIVNFIHNWMIIMTTWNPESRGANALLCGRVEIVRLFSVVCL